MGKPRNPERASTAETLLRQDLLTGYGAPQGTAVLAPVGWGGCGLGPENPRARARRMAADGRAEHLVERERGSAPAGARYQTFVRDGSRLAGSRPLCGCRFARTPVAGPDLPGAGVSTTNTCSRLSEQTSVLRLVPTQTAESRSPISRAGAPFPKRRNSPVGVTSNTAGSCCVACSGLRNSDGRPGANVEV